MFQLLVNLLYRYPRSFISMSKKHKGMSNYIIMIYNQWLMKKMASKISPIASDSKGFPIYFLTGRKYLYQTLFCIKSLDKCSDTKFKFILVDDGSFDEKLISHIKEKLIGAEVITTETINKNLEKKLPVAQFPLLHYKRKIYPHIKKLTDIHSISDNNWKLVLDSDMLFWKDPKEITNWLNNPTCPIYMLDIQESYGYTTKLMKDICKKEIPKKLNVGIIGLNSASINWTDIENWIRSLEDNEGTTYFLEQALSAMLIGDQKSILLNNQNYIVYPTLEHIKNKQGTLHHYVDLSKEGYFNFGWKYINE